MLWKGYGRFLLPIGEASATLEAALETYIALAISGTTLNSR